MLQLEAARYRSIRTDRVGPAPPSANEAVEKLANILAEQFDRTFTQDVALTMVVSTVLDLPLASNWMPASALAEAVTKRRGRSFDVFVNAYECASWGYGLRYACSQVSRPGRIALAILDANPLGLSYWRENPNWGRSGFGLTTLLLGRGDYTPSSIATGVAIGSNGVAEFCLWLRQGMTERPGAILSAPFFPPKIYRPFERALPPATRLPNLHDTWGHCFGSDPWIGVIRAAGSRVPCRVASLALNGYWCAADVLVGPDTLLAIDEEVELA